MDDKSKDPFAKINHPTADRPLSGHSVLLVEDSRVCAEAVRFFCLRSGARLRRADSLRSAHRHLAVYRPSVVLVDLGLPDGSGLSLIEELAAGPSPTIPVIAISGEDPTICSLAAREAGAIGFLQKPIPHLAHFQRAILLAIGQDSAAPKITKVVQAESFDPQTTLDDLTFLKRRLDNLPDKPSPMEVDYCAQFLGSVAVVSNEPALQRASNAMKQQLSEGCDRQKLLREVSELLAERLSESV
jgi:CheY-like chemotaxis protein